MHRMEIAQAIESLRSDIRLGLTTTDATDRLRIHGPNEIVEARRRGPLSILLSQFSDFMIAVLIAAAVVAGLVGEPEDTIAIVAIVLLNGLIGFVQEYRAEAAVAALRKLGAPNARVQREGEVRSVPARKLVPGDIVLIEAGDVVPADLRLVDIARLAIDESALTGESQPVDKIVAALPDGELGIGDRRNLAYRGTVVTRGRGRGVAFATGMSTELGRIAALLHGAEPTRTPLQRRLAVFGQRLAIGVLAVCAIIFGAGLLRGEPAVLMFLTAVSLAVAAIPEALPAVVTVSLALGARRMVAGQALIRRLPAVETLGSVSVICSDKTGTLTCNRMRAVSLHVAGQTLDPAAVGSDRKLDAATGTSDRSGAVPIAADRALAATTRPVEHVVSREALDDLLRAMALNNDATVARDGAASGDPTEVALHLAAAAAGFDRSQLDRDWPRIAEVPFDSTRKRMTTVHAGAEGNLAIVKGAPESLLPRCRYGRDGRRLDRSALNDVLGAADGLAAAGQRVLAYASRPLLSEDPVDESIESDLALLGLVGLIDPPRPEAADAVRLCKSAGIVPVMITGDHPATALAIAREVGIVADRSSALTGAELARLSPGEFDRAVRAARVCARVDPEQKIRIVEALQGAGEVVAMTGDGVNDAPALRRADIGVAMGRVGTDVAREAAHMVLLDDNFATIVTAVGEGRRIYDNIRKFIRFVMTGNAGEIWTLFLAPFLGMPMPLLPIQILWVNLVTDGLPGLALSLEPADRGVMQRPPRPLAESVFAHGTWQHIGWVGLLIGGVSLLAQAQGLAAGTPAWQTMVFTVLAFAQLFHVMAIRSETRSLASLGLFSNPALLGAVALSVVLHLAIVYLPPLQSIFKTVPLSASELAFCVGLASIILVAVEFEKWLRRSGRWVALIGN